MKSLYLIPICLWMFSSTQNIKAQTDSIPAEESYDLPVIDEEWNPEEGEVVPNFDYGNDEIDFSSYSPQVKKYEFQARFGFGFMNTGKALPSVSAPGSYGSYLPENKFLTSNMINFELTFGRNLYKGLVRLWFGFGMEDESFTFVNPNVRILTRSDSFAHVVVDPQGQAAIGKQEDAKKSELLISSITVPLLIGYQNKARRPTLQIKAGAYLGYRYSTQSSVEYQDGARVNVSGNLHVNPYIIDPFISVQYKFFGVFARTSVLPFLQKVGSGNEQMRNVFGAFFAF